MTDIVPTVPPNGGCKTRSWQEELPTILNILNPETTCDVKERDERPTLKKSFGEFDQVGTYWARGPDFHNPPLLGFAELFHR
ncbi:hypothetical protein J6590_039134 [Homalodisca vitripennis]|nr:hypothetical protein J6590_039134 [Homalodisca vitripennis]